MRKLHVYICIIFMIAGSSVKAESIRINDLKKDTLNGKQISIISTDIEQKFFTLTEFNSALGLVKINVPESNYYVGMSEVVGYKIKNNLWTGIGSGVMFYNGGTLLPLYLDNKYFLGQKELRSFFNFNIGSLIRLSGVEVTPRVFINPGYGLKFKLSPNTALLTSIGLLTQWVIEGTKHRDSFINFKIGVAFY